MMKTFCQETLQVGVLSRFSRIHAKSGV